MCWSGANGGVKKKTFKKVDFVTSNEMDELLKKREHWLLFAAATAGGIQFDSMSYSSSSELLPH